MHFIWSWIIFLLASFFFTTNNTCSQCTVGISFTEVRKEVTLLDQNGVLQYSFSKITLNAKKYRFEKKFTVLPFVIYFAYCNIKNALSTFFGFPFEVVGEYGRVTSTVFLAVLVCTTWSSLLLNKQFNLLVVIINKHC